jgi:hypothetical protein
MVLKITFILAFMTGMFVSLPDSLIDQYHSKITRDVRKLNKLKKSIPIEFEPIYNSTNFLESYKIKHNQDSHGLLFLKEVKSCNLNGCVAKEILNDNIGAEYFDISVITDETLQIKSIRVLDYFSDYGYEISSRRYLAKFKGKNLCDISVEHPQVDGISGATISYDALISSLVDFCEISE